MPYSTATVESIIKFISKKLDENVALDVTDWINKNIIPKGSKVALKQAFVKAQEVIFQDYIIKKNDTAKIASLLGAINSCGNDKLTKLECDILADVCVQEKQKGFLSANKEAHKALVKILQDQGNLVKDANLKKNVAEKISAVKAIVSSNPEEASSSSSEIGPFTSPITESTPVISSSRKSKLELKPHIQSFVENLFKMNMSHDVLVDVVINDDPLNNKTLIVGRPKVLGSASKQMRHISPYSFLESAIKSTILATSSKDDYMVYIQNLYETIKPLIQVKEGICLTSDQYAKVVSELDIEDDNVQKSFSLKTQTANKQQNEYHLISNEEVISKFKEIYKDNQSIIKKAEKSFKDKFTKYIDYGIKYLTDSLDPQDSNSITMTCEAFARIILTMFNQDKYVAFPDEGNSIKEEMRVYEDANNAKDKKILKLKIQDQKDKGYFKVRHHDEFVQDIEDTNSNSKLADYDSRIRFIDNEGITIQNVSKALTILNKLLYYASLDKYGQDLEVDIQEKIQERQTEYNTKYNIDVKEAFGVDDAIYNSAIDYDNNLQSTYHYHAAKHLYLAFDYKPLENKVLAPGASNTIKVYPSATGDRVANYSIQEGKIYRDVEVNAAKGYNDNVIFRANMSGDAIKASLTKACIKHVKIALISFKSLKDGCDTQTPDEGKTISEQFVQLVQEAYNNKHSQDCNGQEVNLDDTWAQNITTTYMNETLNLSGVSIPTEENYDV